MILVTKNFVYILFPFCLFSIDNHVDPLCQGCLHFSLQLRSLSCVLWPRSNYLLYTWWPGDTLKHSILPKRTYSFSKAAFPSVFSLYLSDSIFSPLSPRVQEWSWVLKPLRNSIITHQILDLILPSMTNASLVPAWKIAADAVILIFDLNSKNPQSIWEDHVTSVLEILTCFSLPSIVRFRLRTSGKAPRTPQPGCALQYTFYLF